MTALLGIMWLAYGLVFYTLSQEYGRALGALATVPVVATGWCCGYRMGVIGGLITIPLNFTLISNELNYIYLFKKFEK